MDDFPIGVYALENTSGGENSGGSTGEGPAQPEPAPTGAGGATGPVHH